MEEDLKEWLKETWSRWVSWFRLSIFTLIVAITWAILSRWVFTYGYGDVVGIHGNSISIKNSDSDGYVYYYSEDVEGYKIGDFVRYNMRFKQVKSIKVIE